MVSAPGWEATLTKGSCWCTTFRVIDILMNGHFNVTILVLMGLYPPTIHMLSTHVHGLEATLTK